MFYDGNDDPSSAAAAAARNERVPKIDAKPVIYGRR